MSLRDLLELQGQSPHHKCNCPLQELLGQVGHYSSKVREDALQGMAELLSNHPTELKTQVCFRATVWLEQDFPVPTTVLYLGYMQAGEGHI